MSTNILFITSTRIGDAVLSTGLLNHVLATWPDARITLACGPLVVSLFEGLPGLHRIIALNKQSWNRHWIKLWRQVVGTKWDVVIDLRNSAVSRLIRADKRYIYGPHINSGQHKVLQNADVMKSSYIPSPCLFISPRQAKKAAMLIPDGPPVLAVGPTANWIGKTWPAENFITLLNQVFSEGGKFHNWRVAVFAAPGEEAIAKQVYESLPVGQRLDLIAKGTPGEAAACIARCQYYIGNDSGLMHCAAASGIPTLGLFGPTNDMLYAPYGPQARFVRTPQSFAKLTGAPDFVAKNVKKSLMGDLTVDTVINAL